MTNSSRLAIDLVGSLIHPFTLLSTLALVSSGTLHALGDKPPLRSSAPISWRFDSIPALPKPPENETEDPVELTCANLTNLLESHVNPLPIVDWMNFSNIPSFFQPTVRSLLKRDEYYNSLDTLGKYSLGVQPYGFYSNFDLEEEKFKLMTFGVNVDGAVTVFDRWVVGGGLGYLHSNLDWGKRDNGTKVNSLYGGPFGGYIWDEAYVGLTVLGAYNFYKINKLLIDKGNQSHHGWDVGARLEGAYDYEWTRYFGKNFFIEPNGELSYLYVSQDKIEETKDLSEKKTDKEEEKEEFKATVKDQAYNFMRYRLGVTFKKEFYHAEKGILIPSLSIAWIFMQPLSSSDIKFSCNESEMKTAKHKKYPTSNQLYVGAKVVAINTKAMLLSLGADIYIAKLYPVYAGNLRFEWNW